jgi:hypothetical protein
VKAPFPIAVAVAVAGAAAGRGLLQQPDMAAAVYLWHSAGQERPTFGELPDHGNGYAYLVTCHVVHVHM